MAKSKRISDICYECDDGDFYLLLTAYGWAVVKMIGLGEHYTYSIMEH